MCFDFLQSLYGLQVTIATTHTLHCLLSLYGLQVTIPIKHTLHCLQSLYGLQVTIATNHTLHCLQSSISLRWQTVSSRWYQQPCSSNLGVHCYHWQILLLVDCESPGLSLVQKYGTWCLFLHHDRYHCWQTVSTGVSLTQQS